MSKATNPVYLVSLGFRQCQMSFGDGGLSTSRKHCILGENYHLRTAALIEFPRINVVHPAYHWRPKGGRPSFWPSGSFLLSCDRVLATAFCQDNSGVNGSVLSHNRRDM